MEINEKKKRIVTKIGNVFCATIEDKYKMYFQFIDLDRSQLTSDIIRVFKTRYPLDENPKLETVVLDEVMFHAHVAISWGIRMGLWEKVGKVKFEEPVRLPFKTFNHTNRVLDSNDWRVWYNNEPAIKVTGPLSDEFQHAEWGEIMPPIAIIKRLRDGKHPGYLGRFDNILAQNFSFEEKRDLMLKPHPWNDGY